MRVAAGLGWPDGFVGSEHEMRSFQDDAGREQYADGPLVIEDLPNDERWRARPLREHGVVSSAMVMLGAPRAPAGVLGAHTRAQRTFTGQDLDFLTAVAHVLNGALEGLRTEERIRHDALHDALTGLPNRALLLDRLSDALERADARAAAASRCSSSTSTASRWSTTRSATTPATSCCARSARACAPCCAPSDTVARFGGDEFAVAAARASATRRTRCASPSGSCARFAAPFESRGEPRFCSASVGVVVSDPAGPRGPTELLSDADTAMYRAKERGRGRYEVFDAGLRDRIDGAAADRGRPAPRARGRRRAVGRLPAHRRAADGRDRRASRRCCAGTTPSAA